MTKNLAETIADVLDTDGYECTVLPDYSGRSMYGEETHAISVDCLERVLSSVIRHPDYFTCDGEPDFDEDLRWDHFGKGVVIY